MSSKNGFSRFDFQWIQTGQIFGDFSVNIDGFFLKKFENVH